MTGVDDAELCRGMQAAALCLEYPDAALVEQLPLLRRAADSLRPVAAGELRSFLVEAEQAPIEELQRAYVQTFDLRRRCCPYLTYYAYGDTRKRGMALLRFTHAYREAGAELRSAELPDHLAVVCEFTARVPRSGLRLLSENRAGVELLRMALAEASSPWVHVLDLIRALLPEPAPRDLQRALDLARSGPPAEEVGLEPFAPPEYMGARR